jgi:hypothetical protein
MRQGDIFADIQKLVGPDNYDFTRAEARADFDDALRAEIAKIEDKTLRQHVGEMCKEWRWGLYHAMHPADRSRCRG